MPLDKDTLRQEKNMWFSFFIVTFLVGIGLCLLLMVTSEKAERYKNKYLYLKYHTDRIVRQSSISAENRWRSFYFGEDEVILSPSCTTKTTDIDTSFMQNDSLEVEIKIKVRNQ